MRTHLKLILAATFLAASVFATVTPATAEDSAKPDPMQIARGAKAWANRCKGCHNLRNPKEFTDQAWRVIVHHMQTIAPFPGQMARDIEVFLVNSN